MYTSDSFKIAERNISDELESIADDLALASTLFLLKGVKGNDLYRWYGLQISASLLFTRELNKLAEKKIKGLDKFINEQYENVNKLASKELGREVKFAPLNADIEIATIKEAVSKSRDNVIQQVASRYNGLKEKTQPLYKTIFQSMGNLKDQVKIAYTKKTPQPDGTIKYTTRNVSYKSYIDMRVRTDIQRQATDLLLAGDGKLFRATSYSDCAPDHKDYQGKVYVKEKYQNEYPHLKTVEWVVGAPVYLTTRPNCRHILIPVKNESDKPQPVYRSKEVDKNYELLEHQRDLERNIRKAKTKKQILENELTFAKKGSDSYNQINSDIHSVNQRITSYNSEIRNLVNNNDFLKRQPRREREDQVSYDLGVKLNGDLGA